MNDTTPNPLATWNTIGRIEGEALEHSARVMARAVEVFGNSIAAAVWASGFSEVIRGGPGQIRDRICKPEGALDALVELDRLAQTIVPRPYEVPKRRGRR